MVDRPRLPPRPGLYRGPVVEVQAQPVSEPRPAVPPDPGSNPEVARAPKSARTPTLRSASRFDSSLIWAAAKTWSPAGIAAAITLVFLALGGREGVLALAQGLSESISGARALTAEMAALRSEMGALRAEIAAERDQRQTLSANLRRTERNLSLVCDLASETNGGRPHRSWCSEDDRAVRFDAPPAGVDRLPRLVTATQWAQAATQ